MSALFDLSMQDSRLGLTVSCEYPFSLLYSLSIHPITPVFCVSCMNTVSMPSVWVFVCVLLPRDPDDLAPFHVASLVSQRCYFILSGLCPHTDKGPLVDISSATPSYYPRPVGWHIVTYTLILSRVHWLTSCQPRPHTIPGSLVDISSAMPSYIQGSLASV